MHQWKAIFPTEVNKFDLPDTTVKVDTSTLRVGTITGQIQIPEKIPREITRNIVNITSLNGTAS